MKHRRNRPPKKKKGQRKEHGFVVGAHLLPAELQQPEDNVPLGSGMVISQTFNDSTSHTGERQDKHKRKIDPSNDLYPDPLMTRNPSRKATGDEILFKALAYLSVERVHELVAKYRYLCEDESLSFHHTCQALKEGGTDVSSKNLPDDPDAIDLLATTYYGENVLHRLLCGNTGGNYTYMHNRKIYGELLVYFLTHLPRPALAHCLAQKNAFSRTPLDEAIYNGSYHFALCLLDHGSPPPSIVKSSSGIYPPFSTLFLGSDTPPEKIEVSPGFWLEVQDDDKEYPLSDRLSLLLANLHKLSKKEDTGSLTCPISTDPIKWPAILDDGSMYEAKPLLNWYYTRPVDLKALYANYQQARSDDELESTRALCEQWSGAFTYTSVLTNVPLSDERAVYLPLGTEESPGVPQFLYLDEII